MQTYEIALNGKTIWSRLTTESAAYSTLVRLTDLMGRLGVSGVMELRGAA